MKKTSTVGPKVKIHGPIKPGGSAPGSKKMGPYYGGVTKSPAILPNYPGQ